MNRKFVAYYRVSTARQGESGLGLDAQRQAVERFLNGDRWSLVGEFTEVETGKRNDRPELAKALAACQAHRAKLIIAKLDRLSRNLAFIAALMESGVEFVAADNPYANKLTVHILAAVAQYEREAISERTKVALAAAKARGVKLGNPNGARALRGKQIGNEAAVASIKAGAQRRAGSIMHIVEECRAEGRGSVRKLADCLNERGVFTPLGRKWHPTSVARLLRRLDPKREGGSDVKLAPGR